MIYFLPTTTSPLLVSIFKVVRLVVIRRSQKNPPPIPHHIVLTYLVKSEGTPACFQSPHCVNFLSAVDKSRKDGIAGILATKMTPTIRNPNNKARMSHDMN